MAAVQDPFKIFRVPAHIRSHKNNDRYLEPRVVSIGPYHRDKDHLQAMQTHKNRYLSEFLKQSRSGREIYENSLRELLPSVKECYFESFDDNALLEILLLDGCFILQILIKCEKFVSPKKNLEKDDDIENDPVFSVGWNFPLITTDLLMLENQIPFQVLLKFYELYYKATLKDFIYPKEKMWVRALKNLILNFIKYIEARKIKEVDTNINKWLGQPNYEESWESKIHHLLHFYYMAYMPILENYPPEETRPSDSSPAQGNGGAQNKVYFSHPRRIPCASELKIFGITFMKQENPNNFLNISFEQGTLKIPPTSIEEATKAKYANLIAFEQSYGMLKAKHMTSYVLFMDFLINTAKDVSVLQRKNIIENKLANEDEMAEFFSQFHGCCYINFDKHFLAAVFRDVKAHCETSWPKHRAMLYRDYFSNPWAIFSLIGGLIILICSVLQTILSAYSAFHSDQTCICN